MESTYLKSLMDSIKETIEMRDRLNFRIKAINEKIKNNRDYDEYDINEFHITLIKTQGEVNALTRVINEKQEYFKNYAEEYQRDLKECNVNYDAVVEKAKLVKSKRPDIANALDTVKWDIQKNNEEAKVFFYKRLKDLLAK
jgi:hypothetical protein